MSVFNTPSVVAYKATSDSRNQIIQKMAEKGEIKRREVKWWSKDTLNNQDTNYQISQIASIGSVVIALSLVAIMLSVGALFANGSILNDHLFMKGVVSLGASFTILGSVGLGISSFLRYHYLNKPLHKEEAAKFIEEMRRTERRHSEPLNMM